MRIRHVAPKNLPFPSTPFLLTSIRLSISVTESWSACDMRHPINPHKSQRVRTLAASLCFSFPVWSPLQQRFLLLHKLPLPGATSLHLDQTSRSTQGEFSTGNTPSYTSDTWRESEWERLTEVIPPLAGITTGECCLYSSLQNVSSYEIFLGDLACTVCLRFTHRFSIMFKVCKANQTLQLAFPEVLHGRFWVMFWFTVLLSNPARFQLWLLDWLWHIYLCKVSWATGYHKTPKHDTFTHMLNSASNAAHFFHQTDLWWL